MKEEYIETEGPEYWIVLTGEDGCETGYCADCQMPEDSINWTREQQLKYIEKHGTVVASVLGVFWKNQRR